MLPENNEFYQIFVFTVWQQRSFMKLIAFEKKNLENASTTLLYFLTQRQLTRDLTRTHTLIHSHVYSHTYSEITHSILVSHILSWTRYIIRALVLYSLPPEAATGNASSFTISLLSGSVWGAALHPAKAQLSVCARPQHKQHEHALHDWPCMHHCSSMFTNKEQIFSESQSLIKNHKSNCKKYSWYKSFIFRNYCLTLLCSIAAHNTFV